MFPLKTLQSNYLVISTNLFIYKKWTYKLFELLDVQNHLHTSIYF
jgi:hypothetical protein